MITLHDLEEAIAECQGDRNPKASTCIKLAAFYTIRREMFGERLGGDGDKDSTPVLPSYSASAAPETQEQAETYIAFDSGSEFSRAIDGKDAYAAWAVMDELMEVLNATNPRLYNGVMRKVQEI